MEKNTAIINISEIIYIEKNKKWFRTSLFYIITICIIISLSMFNIFNTFYTNKYEVITHIMLFLAYSYCLVFFFSFFKNMKKETLSKNLENNLKKLNLNEKDFKEIKNKIKGKYNIEFIEKFLINYIKEKQDKINLTIKEGK